MTNLPDYTRTERRLDAIVHAASVLLTAAAAAWLLIGVYAIGGVERAVAATVYCAGLATTFGASAAYHLSPASDWKEAFRCLDRAAIYLMIAGSYTPFLLVALGGGAGTVLLALVWLVSAGGVALTVLRPRRYERVSIVLYLVLGWVGLLTLGRLIDALPLDILALLGAGGLLYSGGVVFHIWDRLPGNNVIWHTIVLAAAACHYFAVLRTLIG